MQTYVDAYNGDDSIPVFVAFAIEQYKNNKGISGEEAARQSISHQITSCRIVKLRFHNSMPSRFTLMLNGV